MTATPRDIISSCDIYEKNSRTSEPFFSEFDSALRRTTLFHTCFICLLLAEIALFLAFFVFLSESMLLALSLAGIFFTIFAYATLRVYFQAKVPQQLKNIKAEFTEAYKNSINYSEGTPEHHVSLANSYCKLANKLHCREYNFFPLPNLLHSIAPLSERLSCICHWKDVHAMRELLLQGAVDEYIKLVKSQPTNLEAHAALANAYVMLSGIYVDPRQMEGYDDDRWIPAEKFGPKFQEAFRSVAERAIEEFKILGDYAPDDPWVHTQLAYSYHDLQMPLEEIEQFEIIHKLVPEDLDTLYKLGMLYFQQGQNAKGLKVYEELKRRHYPKADLLIRHYGSFIHSRAQ